MTDVDTLQQLQQGDRVLFNDRRDPLTVTEAGADRVLVEGPGGGAYVLFTAEDRDRVLVASPGKREYASYVEELRTVGRWEQDGDAWTHTGTGATVTLTRNDAGFWTVTVDGLPDVDVPRYGFTDKEAAREAAQEIVDSHPEGGADA